MNAGLSCRYTGAMYVNDQNVYDEIALTIDQRTEEHIKNHSPNSVEIGCLLFDRQRQVITKSTKGTTLFTNLCYNGQNF